MMSPTDRPSSSGSRSIATALWANAALLAVILVVLLTRSNIPSILPAAFAQNQPPIAGGAGVFVMPAQMQQNVWGAFLLDVDAKTLCAYQFYPGEKKLRLVAARSYKWDTKLEAFNVDMPPKEVKAWVEKQQAGLDPAAPPDNNKDNK
jgi:hypothetical protein